MSKIKKPSKQDLSDKEKPIVAHVIKRIEEERPGILDGIKNKEEVISEILSTMVSMEFSLEEHHSGPLPSPRTLREYNKIIPDGAERIMTSFENQTNHRMELENNVTSNQMYQSSRGQIFGFIIAILCLAVGLFLILKGYEAAGITIFGLDIVGLASVFVIGKRLQKKNLEENT